MIGHSSLVNTFYNYERKECYSSIVVEARKMLSRVSSLIFLVVSGAGRRKEYSTLASVKRWEEGPALVID